MPIAFYLWVVGGDGVMEKELLYFPRQFEVERAIHCMGLLLWWHDPAPTISPMPFFFSQLAACLLVVFV